MRRSPLREGFTTGSAAAAAAYTAVCLLLGEAGDEAAGKAVSIALPPFEVSKAVPIPSTDRRLTVPIAECGKETDERAWASVCKDAGDDPDATHGALVVVHAAKTAFPAHAGMHGPVVMLGGLSGDLPEGAHEGGTASGRVQGVLLYAGEGIGLVTLPGLPVPPGEPAINPEPRKQIVFAALEAAARHSYSGPLHICVSVPEGALRAKKTLNGRLGIIGGISILGTRGTVRPFSHEAWKATIEQGLAVADALGLGTVLFATGRRSERLGFELYPDLVPQSGIQAADFAAFAVRRAAARSFSRLVWCCFPGKLLKLAQGLEWTHAKSAAADIALLAHSCRDAGGSAALTAGVAAMPTAAGAFGLMRQEPSVHATVLESIAGRAYATLHGWLGSARSVPELVLEVFSPEEEHLLHMP